MWIVWACALLVKKLFTDSWFWISVIIIVVIIQEICVLKWSFICNTVIYPNPLPPPPSLLHFSCICVQSIVFLYHMCQPLFIESCTTIPFWYTLYLITGSLKIIMLSFHLFECGELFRCWCDGLTLCWLLKWALLVFFHPHSWSS